MIEHERQMDRCVTPSTVQINLYDDNEDYLNCFDCYIVDCNINDTNRCPDLQIDVYLDDNIITLYLYLFRIYRIVKNKNTFFYKLLFIFYVIHYNVRERWRRIVV